MRRDKHRKGQRISWLPAAVLGADDGIVSTASLVIGVAAANGTHTNILIAGTAGLVAGAMSMAASEYVSVHALADDECADLNRRRVRRKTDSTGAHSALVASYVSLGLDPLLAEQVADQLMAHGAVGALARDRLLISPARHSRPTQSAVASASSFAIGAALPVLVAASAPRASLGACVSLTSLISLALLGAWAAQVSRANVLTGSLRVMICGVVAMALTACVGLLFGTVV